MNTDQLHRIADAIEAHPANFNLGSWWGEPGMEERFKHDGTAPDIDDITGCGTTACIAGWAIALNPDHPAARDAAGGNYLGSFLTSQTGADIIGISHGQALQLFVSNRWWGYALEELGYETNQLNGAPYQRIGHVTPTQAAHTLRELANGNLTL